MNIATMDKRGNGNDADSCLSCFGRGGLSIAIGLTYPFTTVPPFG